VNDRIPESFSNIIAKCRPTLPHYARFEMAISAESITAAVAGNRAVLGRLPHNRRH
jgi:hypothetical protein